MRQTLLLLSLLFPALLSAQIQLLNDEFDDAATLSNWLRVNDVEGWNADQLETYDINVSEAGAMTMMPYTSGWFQDRRSTLAFKEVPGNFVMTSRVHVSNRADNGWPAASSTYSLAGVLFRAPRHFPNGPDGPGGWTPGGENYVFLSLGHGSTSGPCLPSTTMNLEVKTTVNSVTNLCLSDVSSNDVTIRVARIDSAIIILYHLPGQPWVVHQRYNRPDFPDTLQAGLHSYTDWAKVSSYDVDFYNRNVINANLNPDPSNNPNLPFNPDIIAEFEYARFFEPIVPNNLQGVDLVSQASDADLLSFLSDTLLLATPEPLSPRLTASPNPVRGELKIEWGKSMRIDRLRLIDLRGVVLKDVAVETLEKTTMDMAELPSGLYLLEYRSGDRVNYQKIMRD